MQRGLVPATRAPVRLVSTPRCRFDRGPRRPLAEARASCARLAGARAGAMDGASVAREPL